MKNHTRLKRDDILHVAKLANLTLTKEEIKKFERQLSQVVDYFRKLNSIDTKGVEPVSQLTKMTNALRDDNPSQNRSLSQDAATKNAKGKKNGYFKVKSIF